MLRVTLATAAFFAQMQYTDASFDGPMINPTMSVMLSLRKLRNTGSLDKATATRAREKSAGSNR
jgi:hypothetical protein